MPENRLIEIESKLTLQEDLLQELNQIVYGQQRKIEQLEQLLDMLVSQVHGLDDALAEHGLVNERPPHY